MFFETRDAQATRALLNVALKKTASHQIDARGVARSAPAAMAAEAARGVETRARKRKRDIEAAQLGVSIPDLPFDVVVIHVLQEKHLPDPADLAVLRAVSKGMRDAVDATGRKIEVVDELHAVGRGYLTTLKSLRRRGSLKNESLVCAAAARSGDLEELKALRENKFPWDHWTCALAAGGGHLEVLQWAHENGCPWGEWTSKSAASVGRLEVLKWLRANGCPLDEETCSSAAHGGQLETLKWLRANDCPWDEETC
jgi:hypothetical protein